MTRRLLIAIVLARALFAHDPVTTDLTWSQEISRIVYRRCATCHRNGGTAPMALVTYGQVRPWAKAIKEEVLERRMPPWGAVKGFGDFRNEASLSQEEILRIAGWVEGGAPEGEPRYLPPLPALLPQSKSSSRPQAIPVRGSTVLQKRLLLKGIHPLGDADSVQVKAVRPDGSVEPLLWLKNYQAKWNRTFLYRSPVELPKGTRILIQPPLAIQLQP